MPASDAQARFDRAEPDYRRRINSYARQNFRALPGSDDKDLAQEILLVLWSACQDYDPNHGATFNTFFWGKVERRFLDLHKAASRKKRQGDYERVSLEAESVRLAVAERTLGDSAEDHYIAEMNVIEHLRAKKKRKKRKAVG